MAVNEQIEALCKELQLPSLANAEVMDWLDYSANARIHQTTLQKPFELLAQEQLQLLPVPKPYLGIHPLKATCRFHSTFPPVSLLCFHLKPE